MVTLAILYKKLARDIRASKWQFTAIVLLAVVGMIFFVGLYSSFQNLWRSIEGPYETLNLADFTVKVYGAPLSVIEEIKRINNIKAVEGRLNIEVPIFKVGMEDEFFTGRVITLPRERRPTVNDVQVVEGAYFSSNSIDEVIVEKAFADYKGLRLDDRLRLISGGNQFEFTIKGIAVSPEYLWPAKNLKDHMPTVLRSWGVIFLQEERGQNILGLDGQINEVAVTVVNQNLRDDTVNEVRNISEPYNVAEVVKRENQPSDKILHLMVGSLDVLAPVLSGFFLIVAGITTYVLLARMVSAQSLQIGTMRALGFGKRPILVYYLSFALLIWAISSVVSIVLGQVATVLLTNLFATRISLPILIIDFQLAPQAIGVSLALVFLMVAAIPPALSAANLNPSVAMRPRAPKAGRVVKIDSVLRLLRVKSSRGKMLLRNLLRSRRRSVSTVLGIMLATSLVVATSSFLDSFDYVFIVYDNVYAYDLQVNFITPQPLSLVEDARAVAGVVTTEPIVEIPYHLRHDGKEYSAIIVGLDTNATLYRLYNVTGEPTNVNSGGILLSRLLRDKLEVQVGDSIDLHLYNSTSSVTVAGFVNTPFGDIAFLPIGKAQEITGLNNTINGVLIKTDEQTEEAVKQEIFTFPAVSRITSTDQQKQDNMEMLKVFNTFIWAIFSFGILMAFAVVFSISSLNILERNRELATMRTIGMSMRKITVLVLLENALLGLIGIIIGLFAGNFLAKYFFTFFTSDLFVVEAVTYPSTYILGIAVIFGVLLISSVPALRYISRLNLARAVKEQAT